MRIIFATLFFAMLGIGSVLSQNTGFGGKRFLIKTTALDGIEGFLTDGGVEIVMGDAWTLTGGLNWQSHERQTDYQAEIRGWGNGCIFDKKVNKSLYVKYRSVYVAGRIYGSAGSKKDFVGAPQGWFGSAGVEGGIMKLDGYYHRGVEHNEAAGLDGSGEPDYVGPCTQDAAEVKYNSNFPFMTFRFGGGYQHFFTPKFSVGFILNSTWAFRSGGSTNDKEIYRGLERSNINSNLVEATLDGVFGMGLSAKVEVGVMLF